MMPTSLHKVGYLNNSPCLPFKRMCLLIHHWNSIHSKYLVIQHMALVLILSAQSQVQERGLKRSWNGMHRCQLYILKWNMVLGLSQICGHSSTQAERCIFTAHQLGIITEWEFYWLMVSTAFVLIRFLSTSIVFHLCSKNTSMINIRCHI